MKVHTACQVGPILRLARLAGLCVALLFTAGCAWAPLGRISMPTLPTTSGAGATPIRLSVEDGLPAGHSIYLSAVYSQGVLSSRTPQRPDRNPQGFRDTVDGAFRDAFQARGFPVGQRGRHLTITLADAFWCMATFFDGGMNVVTGPGLFVAAPTSAVFSTAQIWVVATVQDEGSNEVFRRRYSAVHAFRGFGPLPRDQLVRVVRDVAVSLTGDEMLIAALREGGRRLQPGTAADLIVGPPPGPC